MYCVNCGKQIQENFQLCPYCGVKIAHNAQPTPPPRPHISPQSNGYNYGNQRPNTNQLPNRNNYYNAQPMKRKNPYSAVATWSLVLGILSMVLSFVIIGFRPAIAAVIVGIIGLFLPLVLGSGNSSVDILLQNKIPIILVSLVFLFKFLVTPFCFGSGAVGGIFLPMLMLGAYLGYICGFISNYFGLEINLVAISLIGMASFLSAVARTPITATVMVFEMTGGYNFILPIMLSCAVADLVAEKLHHKPIYS